MAALGIVGAALLVSDAGAAPGDAGQSHHEECGNQILPTLTTVTDHGDCDTYQIKVIKKVTDMGDHEGLTFYFQYECYTAGPEPVVGGGQELIEVYVGQPGMGMSDHIDVGHYDSCTVWEVFPDGGGDMWITEPANRELTYELGVESGPVTEFEFTNMPQPKVATIWVNKVFKGNQDWRFGFGIQCWTEDGTVLDQEFYLGGGGDKHFDVPFRVGPEVLETADTENYRSAHCSLWEDELLGDWDVYIEVDGADYERVDTGVDFYIYPGSEVEVTFTNEPGYLPGRPDVSD